MGFGRTSWTVECWTKNTHTRTTHHSRHSQITIYHRIVAASSIPNVQDLIIFPLNKRTRTDAVISGCLCVCMCALCTRHCFIRRRKVVNTARIKTSNGHFINENAVPTSRPICLDDNRYIEGETSSLIRSSVHLFSINKIGNWSKCTWEAIELCVDSRTKRPQYLPSMQMIGCLLDLISCMLQSHWLLQWIRVRLVTS